MHRTRALQRKGRALTDVAPVLKGIDALPPMPAVAVRLLEVAEDPEVDLGQVGSWLERDPAMTANLLRLTNSPLYALRREVTSLRQAVSLLGLKKLVQIALTVLSSRYLAPAQFGYDLATGGLWKRSVTAAVAAETAARRVGYPQTSTAYTAALLQDVGKIVLADFVGGALSEIRRQVDTEGRTWEEAEQRVVGLPHPEVGALLLERWGFPATLVEAVRTHHRPSEARLDPRLAHISHIADAATVTLGFGLGADGLAYEFQGDSLAALGLRQPHAFEDFVQEVSAQLGREGALLQAPSSGLV